ncbi:UvrD-helicase domain-containing protein [Parapedobacter sp. DT-150]|uniref:UvrD-helicase domain-containing protein n=1 Tax=Parapedobacter sp. DT-150 TaxID=3396162 RepID=UPI003F540721
MPTIPPLTMLKASAGSGKTFSLTVHYLTLLFSGENKYREILAITFTNKATAEMKGRIMEVLEALATGNGQHRDKARGYREILLEAYPQWDALTLQQRAAEVYRKILHDYSRFAVSTIDGFTQKVIRGFTFELGIDAGYKLEMNIRKVKADLVLRLNRLLDERPDLLQWIMDYAQAKIDRDENWNYRWALSDLASEIFKEDFQDFDKAIANMPAQELFDSLDSYCKAAIKQFEESFEQLLKTAADTFAASGVDVMDLSGKSRNQLGKLQSLSAQNPHDVVKKLEKYIHTPDEWQKGSLTGQVAVLYQALNPLLEQLVEHNIERGPDYYLAKAVDENLYYLRLLKEMSALLAEWRRDNGAQLISDAQILLNNIGINESGDPTFIWEKTGSRFRHFLFDEFQDTSRKQWDNLRPLLINAMGNATGQRSEHLIVGDVKQSIYRWRNGDWRILLDRAERELAKAFNVVDTSPLVRHETLETNYRSDEHIVAFNNLLFKQAPEWLQRRLNDRILSELGEEQYERWWLPSGNHDTIIRAYQDSLQQLPPAMHKAGGTVQVDFIDVESNNHRGSAAKDEALNRLADTLIGWMASGTYRPGQIGILVRTNNEAREVIQYLLDKQRESGLAFDVISGDALALANHPAVRLLIDTLRALVGRMPADALYVANCMHLYNQLLHGEAVLPDDWVRMSTCKPAQLVGLLPEPLCRNWEMWSQLPLAELIESLIMAYGLQTHAESLPYLLAFRDLVAAFTAGGERGIPAFLRYWEEEGIDRALPATGRADAVEVITIHKSKGLAFDVVMIPFCSWPIDGRTNGNFWVDTEDTPYALLSKTPVKYKSDLGKSSLFQAYFEEMLFNYMDALNTLYVATTRTRKHLYITAPGKKGDGEINALIAGDLLLEVLPDMAPDLGVVFHGGIRLESAVAAGASKISQAEIMAAPGWSFDHYPASERMKEELARPEIQAELDIVRLDAAKRHGQLLHELMAEATSSIDLEIRLDALQAQGMLQVEDRADVRALALETWNHPQLVRWFSGDYEHWNERSIILSNGRTVRPDKVLVKRDETIVLDFKFTQHEDESHRKQVMDYQLILREMGMPDVKGYVYYGELKKLVQV